MMMMMMMMMIDEQEKNLEGWEGGTDPLSQRLQDTRRSAGSCFTASPTETLFFLIVLHRVPTPAGSVCLCYRVLSILLTLMSRPTGNLICVNVTPPPAATGPSERTIRPPAGQPDRRPAETASYALYLGARRRLTGLHQCQCGLWRTNKPHRTARRAFMCMRVCVCLSVYVWSMSMCGVHV